MTTELAPPVLYDLDLYAALNWLARWAKDKYALDVEVEANDTVPVEDEQLRVLLFEAARELLLNVVKHACVDEARIILQHKGGKLQIVNGSGKARRVADKRCSARVGNMRRPLWGAHGFW